MRAAVAIAIVLLIAIVAAIAAVNSQDPDLAALAERCRINVPAWNGYQEDIKEIGARPVAKWHGKPVSLTSTPGEVRLVMALEPPWDVWEAAIPVLLMDPEGRVVRNDADEIDGPNRIYIFNRPDSASEPTPPWLEIKYPHTKQRLFLDSNGEWHAAVDID